MALHLFLLLSTFLFNFQSELGPQGAWMSDDGVYIFLDGYFAYTEYAVDTFMFTYGGSYVAEADKMVLHYEFHSSESQQVGKDYTVDYKLRGKNLTISGVKCKQLDDGTPGELNGAWLFTNRERDGKMGTPRSQASPRKTMKILSGTRFQWIAYDSSTGRFMGTGGGNYTTINGNYTERIDFFSRDQSRVGASLEFDFEVKGDDWHHKGFSSRGDPMYEIWSRRK